MMRFLVVGAGAVGGLLAARLSLAGHAVDVVARGPHLEAMRGNGLVLETPGGPRRVANVGAFARAADAPRADAVIIALKAYQLAQAAPGLARAIDEAEVVVPIQNGIPWWYFQRHGGIHDGRIIRAVDAEGVLARMIPAARLVPSLAFIAAEVVSPGVVLHTPGKGDAFPMGELDGRNTPRLARLAEAFAVAGIEAPLVDIRQHVWNKLLGNVWANPIGALTGASVPDTANFPATRSLALQMMRETNSVAAALGVTTGVVFEARLARAERLASVKASMLQDLERGRPMELGAILAALVELAGVTGVSVPCAETLLACLQLIEARHRGGVLQATTRESAAV